MADYTWLDSGRPFGGRIITPGSPEFDRERRVWNGIWDRRPSLIAACTSHEDVVSIVRSTSAAGLAMTVRGGGHNVTGAAVADGAVLVDLSVMRGVRVDPGKRLAHVQGGCQLIDADTATQRFGLACPSGVVSDTGIGGLALGGGYGWLARKWGLTCDHLVSAEVVLADGATEHVSATSNPDLYWALRGGGGGFAVVTQFTFRLRQVALVEFRTAVAPPAGAIKALSAFRDSMPAQPDELQTTATVRRADGTSGAQVALASVWLGEPGGLEPATRALYAAAPAAVTPVRQLTYLELQTRSDGSEPPGRRYYTRSGYLPSIPDEAVAVIVDAARCAPSPYSTIDLAYWGGAVRAVAAGSTAFPHRDATFMCSASAAWDDPAGDEANIAWGRGLMMALKPWSSPGGYVNYLHADTIDPALESFGETYKARLGAIKARYDPLGLIHSNHGPAARPEPPRNGSAAAWPRKPGK